MTQRFRNRVVVIVGATGGLGGAIARAFARQGARLLLVGRDPTRLENLAQEFSADTRIYPADLTEPASLTALAEFARTTFDRVDVVANASGVDVRKSFDQHDLADVRHTIDLNLTGAILLTRAFLPILQAQAAGTIVHVGAFADGRLALPYYSVDVASRAGLYTFVESLNRELASTRIQVCYFSPDPADTPAERPYHALWRQMGLAISTPEQVANALLDAVAKRKRVHVMGGVATAWFAKLNAAFPGLADALMLNHYRKILQAFFAPMPSASPTAATTRPWARRLGLGLVILSFVLYGGLATIPFIPASLEIKAALSSALVISGEASFWIGGAILGKQIVARYRQWLDPRNWMSSKNNSVEKKQNDTF